MVKDGNAYAVTILRRIRNQTLKPTFRQQKRMIQVVWGPGNCNKGRERKSNHLPDWERYFAKLCQVEYKSYELMWKNEKVHKYFYELANEHLNNYEIRQKLYREGLSESEFSGQLADVISPVYQSAKNASFMNWVLDYE